MPKAKRVIYLHMEGGPSQLDLFDYKPTLENLVDACGAILNYGYDPGKDCHAVFADHGGVFGPKGKEPTFYRIPIKELVTHGKALKNPKDFVCTQCDGLMFFEYKDLAAAKKRGCSEDQGGKRT